MPATDRTPNNLPLQLTSFIGREREITEVRQLIGTTRLLTLLGTGGVGKTRFALKVASEMLTIFYDGVWFVELALLSEPMLVPQAVISALGVKEHIGQSAPTILAHYFQSKQALLVLDNCEHLVLACATLSETLLRTCSHLHILTTSREQLKVNGEIT